jgi:hypothetical protein
VGVLIKATVVLLTGVVFAAGSGSLARTEAADSLAGRCAGGKPPPATINSIQSLEFQMIRRASFNNFDGREVVRDLLRHRRLWCGAVMDTGDGTLIKLRDIDENAWNVDTLYVLPSGADNIALRRLAQRWRANGIDWVTGAKANQLLGEYGPGTRRILEVWWD